MPSRTLRSALHLTTLTALLAAPLALGTAPASANVDTAIATFPYAQDWSNAALITANDDWSGVAGVQGYLGDDASTTTAGVDPQTLLADTWSATTDVVANAAANSTAGGVVEVQGNSIAMQGSGTADAPNVVFRLDLTAKSAATFSFDAVDLDTGTDNTNQQIAVQYRVGATGVYTNIPAGYIADASAGPSLTLTTHKDVALPDAALGQPNVFVRVMTTNAASNDELIGIDNITVTANSTPVPLAATDPADVTAIVNQPMPSFTLQATGGTAPYTWAATGLPTGVTVSPEGEVAGTPAELGTFTVTATATDSAAPADTASADFVITVEAPAPLAATPVTGDRNGIEGVSIRPFTLTASGGVPPYSWSATGLPDGVAISPTTGEVTGTPTESGDFEVTATVTDDADPAGSSEVTFTLVVAPVLDRTIAEIQGTTDVSPYSGPEPGDAGADYVGTQGVITASYPTGGTGNLGGFFLQTSGAPATPDASDGIFVFMGSSASTTDYAVGDSVEVVGKVSERFGQTQIASNSFQVDELAALPAPVLATSVPGSECTVGECPDAATLQELREAHESEAFDLSGSNHTVTDSYSGGVGSSSMRGEFGIALNSTEPLVIPLEEVPASDLEGLADRNAYNAARGIVLDDGATQTYGATPAYPWLTLTNTVRAGAAAEFKKPVVLSWGFEAWRLQPEARVPAGDDGKTWVEFEQDRPLTPEDVLEGGGNLKIATFNMLNYFVHPAEDWVATGGDAVPGSERKCSYYSGGGERITARECSWVDPRTDPPSLLGDPGPRGAATAVSLSRQQVKEVAAINTMDADIVSLEEVENPVKLGYSDRDLPLKTLVDALNADWAAEHPGEGPRWAFVPSPRPEAQPTVQEQDAIRNAFIYNPRKVDTVGVSQILVNAPAMRNAREPLAQAFKHADGTRDDAFIVITNHFKSKGGPEDPSTIAGTDNEDIGNGAGSYNGDRIRQARALDEFARAVSDDKGIAPVFMTGDYNSYSAEDPIVTLENRGWTTLEAENGETSYFFGGLAGSLDHVLANDAALAMVEGVTIWPINANEPVYYEYSRYKYNAALLYDESAFRSSDHNPEIVGIKAPTSEAPAAVDTVQVLASNDFHGRLLDDPASASAGAAAMAGAVKSLRAANDNTAFVMAGDIVGASTFESFIQNDKPTIDAMNEAGLEVSAAGNHEFDQGYDDLMDRIMSEYDADTNPQGGADWPYIAANVRDAETGEYALDTDRTDGHHEHSNGATWWKDFPTLAGGDGITVGFVGAVTEDLDSLVAPDAIAGLEITDIVDEVNAAAADLKTDGCGGEPCDLVIELVHEGAPSPSCATIKTDEDSTFGRIVHGASTDVDAIISGHTHLKYNCKVAVDGETVDRPVVSAGQYGAYLNQLEFDFAPGTDTLVGIRQHVLAMKDYDEDAPTEVIVDAAVQVADTKGAEELGEVAGPFKRARRIDPQSGVVENRGGESTLGNLVAEIQRDQTGADIGVMNPGGLRDDLIGTGDAAGPVTYREAANVQPFANTLVTVDLTGAQVKLLLEQQWQRDPDGNIPSRPFLRLGTSKGFTWTEDSSRAEGNRITGMWLDGVAIDPAGTYTVSANSFLAVGGDNFRALTLGTNKQDTGKTDLQATVDYLAEHASDAPLPVGYGQHGVGARVPAGTYEAGDTVTIAVDSLSMTGGGTSADVTDVNDTSVTLTHGSTDLGTFPVTTALPNTPYDVPGAASVSFTLPSGLASGTQWFTLTGAATGTVVRVPVAVASTDSTVSGTAANITWGQAGSVSVTVTPSTATGTVELYDGATKIGEGTLTGDATTITVPAGSLAVGDHALTLKYLGDGATKPSQGTVSVTVVKAPTTVSGTGTTIQWTKSGSVPVTVAPAAATGSVELYDGATKLGTATLSGGSASIALAAKSLEVGTHALTVKYLGSATHAASQGTVTVTVTKAKPKVTVSKPETITSGSKARIKVLVGADVTGKVGIVLKKVGGTFKIQLTRKVVDGKVVAKVEVPKKGRFRVKVRYLGDERTSRGWASTHLWVN